MRVVLVCHRSSQIGPVAAEWTYWDSREQAHQAEAELTPCGPLCVGVHSVVSLDSLAEPRRRGRRHRNVTVGTGNAGARGVSR